MCRGRPVHRSFACRMSLVRAITTCSCSGGVRGSSRRGRYDHSLPSGRAGGGPATGTASHLAGTTGSLGQGSAVARRRVTSRLRSEEHTSELQSRFDLVCRLLLEKKKKKK